MNETRLFFVVSGEGSNNEIFETLEHARQYREKVLGTAKASLLRVALVKNAYREDGQWNYEDRKDTFDFMTLYNIYG